MSEEQKLTTEQELSAFATDFRKLHSGEENEEEKQKKILGVSANVKFVNLNKQADAKVDSGATTSSLHATNVKINGDQVSFVSPALSDNEITMSMAGQQDVHTSDNHQKSEIRPMVSFDIEIDGTLVKNVLFNLNDRSHMDTQILLGQDVLKAGNFIIDPAKDEEPLQAKKESVDDQRLLDALQVFIEYDITVEQLVKAIERKTLKEVIY